MKKCLFLIMCSWPFFSSAQFVQFPTPGLNFGSIYNLNIYDGPGYDNTSIKFYRDTFLCGETWSIFTNSLLKAENGQYFWLTNPNCSGKQLMYDFTKEVGEYVTVFNLGTLQVKDKGSFSLDNGEVRIRMDLGKPNSPTILYRWVDGIGDIDRSFFRNSDFEGGFQQLICVRDSANGIFYSNPIHPLDCDSLLCPVPNVHFESSCENRTFHFVNKTKGANSYLWDFGDGATSTEENPTHEYLSTGCFKVVLAAQSDCLPNLPFTFLGFINVDAPHFWKKNATQAPIFSKVQMLDSLNGWATTNKTLWKTHDGWATSDSIVYPGNWRKLGSMDFLDMQHGIVEIAVENSTNPYAFDLLWTNDGINFTTKKVKDNTNFSALLRINDSTAILSAQYQGYFLTKNYGQDWVKTYFSAPIAYVTDFQKMGGDTVYIVGLEQFTKPYNSLIFGKTNDLVNWDFSLFPNLFLPYSMDFVSAQEGWMVNAGGIFHTKNAGQDWENQLFEPVALTEIKFADALHGWATGFHSGVFATEDGGKNWMQQACVRQKEDLSSLNVLSKSTAYLQSIDGWLHFSTQPDTIRTCPTVVKTGDFVENSPPFLIFPNPSSDEITLSFSEELQQNSVQINVFNAFSSLILKNEIDVFPPHLNVTSWPPGVYFIEIQQKNGEKWIARFLKI